MQSLGLFFFFKIVVETFLVLNYLLKLFGPKIVFNIFPISTGAVFFEKSIKGKKFKGRPPDPPLGKVVFSIVQFHTP